MCAVLLGLASVQGKNTPQTARLGEKSGVEVRVPGQNLSCRNEDLKQSRHSQLKARKAKSFGSLTRLLSHGVAEVKADTQKKKINPLGFLSKKG